MSYHTRAAVVWDLLHRRQSKVLMYHGVPAGEDFTGAANFWGYNVPRREFEQQIDYLVRRCNVISLRDLLAGRGVSRIKTNVVITFDDGYENNYTNAFPILEERGVPAVYALATAFVRGSEPLWNDVVEYAVDRTQRSRVELAWDGEKHEFSTADSESRLAMYHWLMHRCVVIDQLQRGEFLATMLTALGVPAGPREMFEHDDYRPMNEEQVAEMARSGLVEFASHSVRHLLLAKLDADTKRAELRESKEEIERMTDVPCKAFCVPGGSYDPELLQIAFETGFDCVLTSDLGTARRGDRIVNRNGVFRGELPRFVDFVHGPVGDMVRLTRRAKSTLRNAFGGNDR